jgi:hypothetical protein
MRGASGVGGVVGSEAVVVVARVEAVGEVAAGEEGVEAGAGVRGAVVVARVVEGEGVVEGEEGEGEEFFQ